MADASDVAPQQRSLIEPAPPRQPSGTRLDLDELRASAIACAYSAAALARHMGISARHLYRLFMREVGCPPGAWLREERLQAARRMLLGPVSVKHVALTLAFPQASQFCR